MKNELQDFVRAALEPEVPDHLYDQEYDATTGMSMEDFLEEIDRPDVTADMMSSGIDFSRSVRHSLRVLESAGNAGMLNELYAQLAALASRRAAARIPELGYWD